MKPAQTKTELLNECGQVVLWVVVLMCHCVVCFPVACTGIHIRTPFPARLEKKKVSTGITRVLNRLPLHSLHSHNLFEMWSRFPLHGRHSWHSWPSGLDYRETGMGRTDRHDGWKKRKESWAGAPVRAAEVNLCLSKEGFLRSLFLRQLHPDLSELVHIQFTCPYRADPYQTARSRLLESASVLNLQACDQHKALQTTTLKCTLIFDLYWTLGFLHEAVVDPVQCYIKAVWQRTKAKDKRLVVS